MNSLGKSILNGFFWSTGSQLLVTFITLVVNIVLARLLGPKEFGIIGIVVFFTTLANVFVASGMGAAIVRLPKYRLEDLKTAFTLNLAISILFYVIIVFASPHIALFYNEPRLKKILLVSGLVLFINAFQVVNNAILVREMRFKQRALYQLVSTLLSSLIAIAAAAFGFGVWSLVVLQLSMPLFMVLHLFFFETFTAKLGWSRMSIRNLFSFGVNITLANLINTAFQNIYQLIIGKYFSIVQVGYFYQAQKLEKVPGNILNYFVQNVLFSGLSKLQHDVQGFNRTYNKFIRVLTIFMGFISAFVYLYGKEIIMLLYGDEWINSAVYLQMLIIASFFFMQEQFNRIIFKVFNKTKQILTLEIVKKGFQVITIYIGIKYDSLQILILGFVVTNIFSFIVNFIFSRKITKDYTEILSILKVAASSISSILIINILINMSNIAGYFRLLTSPVFLVLYIGILYLFLGVNIKQDFIAVKRILKKH